MTTLTLESPGLRCELRPDLGGCMAGLWHGQWPVLRSVPGDSLTQARQSASYPLVPFSNRMGQATLQWQGTSHPLVRNNGTEPHAIHGVGWQRPWAVLEQSPQFALLSYEHRADSSWPFAFDASQTFSLEGARLSQTLSITNQDHKPAPVGLGWHPFFVKRARSRIAMQATGRWEMGDDKLPTHRQKVSGLDAECNFLDIDHCFDGWTGVVHLRDECLHTEIRSSVKHLVVFTHDTRDFVAIEPVTHVNNAMNMLNAGRGFQPEDLGLRVLQPGESMTIEMSIQVTPVHAP
jgi:aldose 1-epimerase